MKHKNRRFPVKARAGKEALNHGKLLTRNCKKPIDSVNLKKGV
jgi:hypothetical protein